MIQPINGRRVQNFYTPVTYMADRKTHQADDWVTNGYQPIYAPADAVVTQVIDGFGEVWLNWLASRQNHGFGNHVEIKFSDGAIMTASHLRKGIPVTVGQKISKGSIIGFSGRTGYRVPLPVYHTHIEIKIGGQRVDPQQYTAPQPAPIAPVVPPVVPPENNQSNDDEDMREHKKMRERFSLRVTDDEKNRKYYVTRNGEGKKSRWSVPFGELLVTLEYFDNVFTEQKEDVILGSWSKDEGQWGILAVISKRPELSIKE